MRIPILLVVALGWLSPLAAADQPPDQPPDQVRVLVWNVNRCVGTDGKRDLARTAAAIRAARPHLVALAEVDQGTAPSGGDDAAALAKAAGLPHHLFAARLDALGQSGGGRIGNAWLARWPLTERQVLPLVVDRRRPCTALACAVELPAVATPRLAARRLILVATDLDQQPTDALAQAAKLVQRLRPVKTAVLLAGDLGTGPNTHKALRQHFGGPPIGAKPPAQHALFAPREAFAVVSDAPLRQGDARHASDHAPRLIVLRRR